ncbi:unnamed protein product [Spirodela intermedia]|uniref:Uncharacterized protein n=1 Tax=Spirodela intermedia TaxID=51605 RepID=A0A7I8IQF1_SPIIN|nr:unnamed protein product [Spirodela intermedia]CAA6660011.1 unnamed protein product [Spirodela intermedia]
MAAPNIDIIAASLRSCSLARGREGSTGGAVVEAADTTLELNSEVALPYHWEQCLDLKTGKIYYINWSTGEIHGGSAEVRRIPRQDGDDADDENDGVEDDDDGGDSSEDSATTDSDDNGNCSSAFSRGAGGWRGGVAAGGSVLVAAGCRVCMMYVMIPKREEECPRCGGHVLHFSRSGDR